MAINPSADYGKTLRCNTDCDELFSTIEGVGAVEQDQKHRLMCDDVLGPSGDSWGFDCRKLLGLPASELAKFQPVLVEVLTRDDRVLGASVLLTATITNGMADVALDISCETTLGPFALTTTVLELSEEFLQAQAS